MMAILILTGTVALAYQVSAKNLEGMLKVSITYTDPISVVSVWMKDGLLCELFVLPIIAEASSPAKAL